MTRLLFLVALASLACKWISGSWPWEYLRLRPTRSKASSNARKLLAVSANASRSEILDAHRRLIAMVHPDKGGSDNQVHEANAARDLLLDELTDVN